MNNSQMLVNMILNQNPQLRNNPIVSNAINMISSGNMQGLNTLVNNVCQERGIDMSQTLNMLKNQNGL